MNYRPSEKNGVWYAEYIYKQPSGKRVKKVRLDMFNKPLTFDSQGEAKDWCDAKNIIDKL